MVLSQLVSLPYNANQASFSLERDNLGGVLILRELFSWKLKDKLNKLNELIVVVFKDSVNQDDVYFERKVFVPAFDFNGIITSIIDNNDETLTIILKEQAWHFTRRIYKMEDALKEYNIKLVDPASLSDFLQLILDSANKDMFSTSTTAIPNLVSLHRLNGTPDDDKGSNDGTWTGTPVYTTGFYLNDQAADFDGTKRINLANEGNFDFEHTQAFSIAVWLRLPTDVGSGVIVAKGLNASGAPTAGYYLNKDSAETITFRIGDSISTNFSITTSSAIAIDTWVHIVATYDGSSNRSGMKVYLDGVLAVTGTASAISNSILNNETVAIAGESAGGIELDGLVDDVRLYSGELTSEQVRSLANTTRSDIDVITDYFKWVLGEDIPATSDFDFDIKWKSYYEVLRLVAKNSANDVWFEDNRVFFGTKGKTINLDRDEKVYNKLKSKIDLDIYGSIVHVVGAEVAGVNVHANASALVTDLQFTYERVVSNNNLKTQAAVDGVVNRVLDEFNTTTPDVTIDITESVIHKYNMQSGDVIKINSNTQTQNIKGFFRIIEVLLGNQKSSLKLQFSKDGQFLPKISDSLDILSAALIKIHDLELNS